MMAKYNKPTKAEQEFWDNFDRQMDAIFAHYAKEWGAEDDERDDS